MMMPRLKVLIAVHLVIGVCMVATHPLPFYFRFRPYLYGSLIHPVVQSVTLAQLMLLPFWVGMGTNTAIRRLMGMLLGTLYLALWPKVAMSFIPLRGVLAYNPLDTVKMEVVFAGVFLGIRRWKAEVRCFPGQEATLPPTDFQYSLLHLVAIVSVVAIILGLVRSSRAAIGEEIGWYPVLQYWTSMIVFLINLLAAVWAVLSVGRPGVRIFLVILIAVILGATRFFATRYDPLRHWWVLIGLTVTSVAATAIVVISLLVVRSCGYRFVPKNLKERV